MAGYLSRLEENTEKQLIYVIGGIDSGKTILCRFLAERLSVKHKTAYINCDPGQSVIGPPASLGMDGSMSRKWHAYSSRLQACLPLPQ
jgi:polynucleotide 5'-hydroxyl-kinase GRC3/NOL9